MLDFGKPIFFLAARFLTYAKGNSKNAYIYDVIRD